jgi:NAD(P)H dehydrogenase (quinone)
MLLITGATGHLGSNIVNQLLRKSNTESFVTFARNEEKAQSLKQKGIQVRIGNFDDPVSLESAFQGIDKLLLISTMEFNRLQQHRNVVDAAVKAGVKHIVYTGIAIQDVHSSAVKELMFIHFQTEEYIIQSGLTYTFIRNTLYAESIKNILGIDIQESGIFLPAGQGRAPYVLRREMGEAIANLLLQEGHENKTYQLTGNATYSCEEIAQSLSVLTGKKISYTHTDAGMFLHILRQSGTPEFLIYLRSGIIYDIDQQQFEINHEVLETLLGRPAASLETMLKEVYKLEQVL